MDEFFLKMKEKLLQNKNEILKQIAESSDDFEKFGTTRSGNDDVDMYMEESGKKIMNTMLSQSSKQLEAIDAALLRIENGTYGICIQCGKHIPTERLEAIPFALLCIDCKRANER
jgi:RNA polymerase-binding protein DksA